jgi:hypothetical protein
VAEGHSAAGRSIIEMLWEQADILYAKLMDVDQAWAVEDIAEYDFQGAEEDAQSVADYWELRGKLGGLSYALGRMLHTYDKPKDAIDKIKAELRERWEAEEEEE